MKTLVPGPYSASITRLDEGYFGDRRSAEEAAAYAALARGDTGPAEVLQFRRKGSTRSAPIRFRLIANEPMLLFNDNPRRKGLLIQNRDAVAGLNIAFGHVADTNDFNLAALGIMLLDFVCPTDAVYVISTVAISGVAYEFA